MHSAARMRRHGPATASLDHVTSKIGKVGREHASRHDLSRLVFAPTACDARAAHSGRPCTVYGTLRRWLQRTCVLIASVIASVGTRVALGPVIL